MMWRSIVEAAAIALLVTACSSTASAPMSAAEQCVRGGGVWRDVVGTCEGAAGGGGAY